jgi:hypothetical protein
MSKINPNLLKVTNAEAWPKTGCAECMKEGGDWVHLNMCRECGHVGCCNSSPKQHSQKHFHETGHVIVQRFEPGEDWGYDWAKDEMIEPFPKEIASSERHPSWESGYVPHAPKPFGGRALENDDRHQRRAGRFSDGT